MANACDNIAARGQWGTVEWAGVPLNEVSQAQKFFSNLDETDKAKSLVLFKRLAEFGKIINREKFKQLGDKAGKEASGLFQFKSHQIRFIGDFRPGGRFIVAWGVRKKKDQLDKSDIQSALLVLIEFDAVNGKYAR